MHVSGNVDQMVKLTMEQWKKKHRDYKAIVKGKRYILRLDPKTGATELVPVEITRQKRR